MQANQRLQAFVGMSTEKSALLSAAYEELQAYYEENQRVSSILAAVQGEMGLFQVDFAAVVVRERPAVLLARGWCAILPKACWTRHGLTPWSAQGVPVWSRPSSAHVHQYATP